MDLAEKDKAERDEIAKYPTLEVDPTQGGTGILLSDEITYFARNHHLIEPFKQQNLKPAGYELTVGDEYFLNGQFMKLDSNITIQPFEVAVVKTGERVRLPRFMIARWNIRVRHAYAGLLWVGGPQVDPGYAGYLFCPLYNLSDKPVTLLQGEELALIDFSRTTKFDPAKPADELVRYKSPPTRVVLEQFGIKDFQSALFTRAGRKIEEFEDTLKTLEGRFIQFTQISFAVFAMVLTMLAIYSKAGASALDDYAGFLGPFTLAFAIYAFFLAFFSHWQSRIARYVIDRYPAGLGQRVRDTRRFLLGAWYRNMIVAGLLALLGTAAIIYFLPGATAQKQLKQIATADRKASDALSIAKSMEQRILSLQQESEELKRRLAPAPTEQLSTP
jgi:deoxycytidine triphosphate deaminase